MKAQWNLRLQPPLSPWQRQFSKTRKVPSQITIFGTSCKCPQPLKFYFLLPFVWEHSLLRLAVAQPVNIIIALVAQPINYSIGISMQADFLTHWNHRTRNLFCKCFLLGVASTNLKIYPDLFVSLDGGLGWNRVRHL